MLVNLNDVLLDAQKNHYGVGLFNTTDTDMLEAVIAAAEESLRLLAAEALRQGMEHAVSGKPRPSPHQFPLRQRKILERKR